MTDTDQTQIQIEEAQAASNQYQLTSLLGDLGCLPFVALTALIVDAWVNGQGLQSASLFGLYAPYVFIAYSAVILSFLSGALWERSRLSDQARPPAAAILFSNLVALSAWVSLLLIYLMPLMTLFAVVLLMAGFLSLLWVERLSFARISHGSPNKQSTPNKQITQSSYWSMRLRITALVVIMHAVVLALMVQTLMIQGV